MPGQLRRPLVRCLTLGAACLLALALLAFAAVHVQEHLLRVPAERLSADIRSLQVRQSTFAQATEVFARWRGYGHYDVPCSREYCDFSIHVGEIAAPWSEWELLLFRLTGGRIAGAGASISVRERIVWQTEFGVGVDVPPFRDSRGDLVGYVLESIVFAIPRSTTYALGLSTHPEYWVSGPSGCDGCDDIWVSYTPYANKSDIDRMGRINFDCITRWHPCRTKEDIMPGAMAQALVDDKFFDTRPQPACTAAVIQITSRDAESAAIAEVQGKRHAFGGIVIKVRLIKRLKRAESWKPGSEVNLGLWPFEEPIPLSTYFSRLVPGSRVIVLFDRNVHPRGPVPILTESCGVIALTPSNLRLVESGIQRDRVVHLADNPRSQENFWPAPRKLSTPPDLPLVPDPRF